MQKYLNEWVEIRWLKLLYFPRKVSHQEVESCYWVACNHFRLLKGKLKAAGLSENQLRPIHSWILPTAHRPYAVHPSIHPPTHPSIHPSIRPSIYLSIHPRSNTIACRSLHPQQQIINISKRIRDLNFCSTVSVKLSIRHALNAALIHFGIFTHSNKCIGFSDFVIRLHLCEILWDSAGRRFFLEEFKWY